MIAGISIVNIIILFTSAAFTSVISAVTGMGGGIVFLSILTFFLPLTALVPIHGSVQLISNSTRAYLLRKNIKWQFVIHYALGAPIGAAFATILLKDQISSGFPLLIIAVTIFYSIFRPKKLPALDLPAKGFILVGIVSGVLSILCGATGPFLAPFFIRTDFKKEQIVATKASFQLLAHLLKIPAFLYLNFPYFKFLPLIMLLSLAAILGTKYGIKILSFLPEKAFFIIFKLILFIAGLRVAYKAFYLLTENIK